jgi:asparagine synthase (glutamine-hydrolysing)
LDNWLRNELKDWSYDRVMDSRLVGLPGYDRQAIIKLWEQHQKKVANNSWVLWRWISMSEWLNIYHSGWWRAGSMERPRIA